MPFPCIACSTWDALLVLPTHCSEACAVDGFQLVAVRVAHGADADHTGQLGGEGVAAKGGRQGHGPNICTTSRPTNSRLDAKGGVIAVSHC